jgi:hypothetical protein
MSAPATPAAAHGLGWPLPPVQQSPSGLGWPPDDAAPRATSTSEHSPSEEQG